jgi:flagellar hook-associated protein 1 FlgK
MDGFFRAAQDLSTRPSDDSLKENFLFAAQSLTTRLNGLQDNADILTAQANAGIENSVANINRLSAEIARLNIEITDSTSVQGNIRIEPNDLIDRRAQLIKELSSEIEIQTFPNENGRISLNTRLGAPLVSDGTAFTLEAIPSPDNPGKIVPARVISVDGKPTAIPLSIKELGQSRMGGLLEFRDVQLEKYSAALGDIGKALVARADAIQAKDNTTPAAKGPFEFIAPGSDRIRMREGFGIDDIPISSGISGNDLILELSNIFKSQEAVSDISKPKSSIAEIYRSLVSSVGNQTAQAKNDGLAKQTILSQLEGDKSAFSGVNLDEEAANLIRYQQAYSASGKVIALSRDLFQELLDAAGS